MRVAKQSGGISESDLGNRINMRKYPILRGVVLHRIQHSTKIVSSQMVGLSTSDRRKMKKDASTFHAPSLSEGSRRSIGLSGLQGEKEEICIGGLFLL